jgi:tetratricopeptide (TPR) repeat protein
MKTIDFSYFIERYNSGEMNGPEKAWFEKELDNNADLRKEVELRKKTDKILEDKAVMQLRNKLAAIESTRSVPGPARNPVKHMTLRYAAAFAGILLIGSLLIFHRKPLTVDQIFGKFYASYEAPAPQRSIQDESINDFTRAIEYFNVHDYRNAAMYFNKVIANEPQNFESTMLYGVSNFEGHNYTEAEKSFKKVKENNNTLYLEDAEWYLALCYLRTNEKAKAVDQFTSIRKSSSIYRKSAGKILRSIN